MGTQGPRRSSPLRARLPGARKPQGEAPTFMPWHGSPGRGTPRRHFSLGMTNSTPENGSIVKGRWSRSGVLRGDAPLTGCRKTPALDPGGRRARGPSLRRPSAIWGTRRNLPNLGDLKAQVKRAARSDNAVPVRRTGPQGGPLDVPDTGRRRRPGQHKTTEIPARKVRVVFRIHKAAMYSRMHQPDRSARPIASFTQQPRAMLRTLKRRLTWNR